MTKHIDAGKFRKALRLTRSEKRAADTDSWVKEHLTELREAEARKSSRLKALREARDAGLPPSETEPISRCAKP
jgi:hypothetical protein